MTAQPSQHKSEDIVLEMKYYKYWKENSGQVEQSSPNEHTLINRVWLFLQLIFIGLRTLFDAEIAILCASETHHFF